jgi:hypothetical protein
MRLGQNSKQRCLAYLGQADNAGFHKGLLALSYGAEFRTGLTVCAAGLETTFKDKG